MRCIPSSFRKGLSRRRLSPVEGPPALPGCHVNSLSVLRVWGQKSRDLMPCQANLLLIVKLLRIKVGY